jgi:ADP-heptose:LPS heptosyltransferase
LKNLGLEIREEYKQRGWPSLRTGGDPLLRKALGTTGEAGTGRGLLVHPGSGSKRKNWPVERYLRVAQAMVQQGEVPVTILIGPAESDQLAFWRQESHAGVTLKNGLSIQEVCCLLSRTELYLGNDSGISHLAASLGVYTIALFGPTDPARWSPLGPRVRVLFPSEDPAEGNPPSQEIPERNASLEAISPEQVLSVLCEITKDPSHPFSGSG